ncbi:MAG: hypothetical protein EBV06_16540 [Planctomycetia bacterium]|nr:hypothetical protein [Planctomycetia bacterium]
MLTVRCPSCSRLLRGFDDNAGKEVKCPACQTVFLAEPEGGTALPYQRPVTVPDPETPWKPKSEASNSEPPTPTTQQANDSPFKLKNTKADVALARLQWMARIVLCHSFFFCCSGHKIYLYRLDRFSTLLFLLFMIRPLISIIMNLLAVNSLKPDYTMRTKLFLNLILVHLLFYILELFDYIRLLSGRLPLFIIEWIIPVCLYISVTSLICFFLIFFSWKAHSAIRDQKQKQ